VKFSDCYAPGQDHAATAAVWSALRKIQYLTK
jgi:hypothetical protein